MHSKFILDLDHVLGKWMKSKVGVKGQTIKIVVVIRDLVSRNTQNIIFTVAGVDIVSFFFL